MANIQIPNLPAAIALSGLEQLEIVQNGVSSRTTTQAIANLVNVGSIQAIAAFKTVPCASFYSTATQTIGSPGVEGIVSCNNTNFQYDITLFSNTQFTPSVAGIYDFQFSLRFTTPSNTGRVFVWLKKNGVAIPNTNTEIDIPSTTVLSWGGSAISSYFAANFNFSLSLNASEYVQIAWTSDVGATIVPTASPTYGPAIPSAIVNMNLVRRT